MKHDDLTARIGFNKKELWLGLFETADEAARVYNEKAVELFGEFARLNLSPETITV
jgi:hypothetical protein